MIDMVTQGGSPLNGGIPYSKINDTATDCKNLPDVCSPPMKHSLEMAGQNIGLECGGLGEGI